VGANNSQRGAKILVVADDEELRDGIEALLEADGYRISPVRNEQAALDSAVRERPDLILVSLAQSGPEVTATSRLVRERAGLTENVPIVVFGDRTMAEGAELAIGQNTYVTQPENFNQLTKLLARLLRTPRAIF
jgi:DNA-binding response OmpR family regulator